MTEEQYKELQAWCRSGINKKAYPEEYAKKVALRNKAKIIRRTLIGFRTSIKDAMFVLEACKEPEMIEKWKGIINTYKAHRDDWQDKFNQL